MATKITNVDSSRWAFAYDSLGQVTSGKRYWSDGTVVPGQQFEYGFDDIGNQTFAGSGGDEWGANLRYENYTANSLNQYTQRTVPPYVNLIGAATNYATVTVNVQPTYRKAEYFRAELSADNSSGPLWFGVTNVGVLTNGSSPNIVTTNQGNLLVAKATEPFFHDLDGNLIGDSLWTNVWNAENRLIATESASAVPSAGKAKETWTHLADGRWHERVLWSWNGSAHVPQSTNRFVWDGQVLLAMLDHTNALVMDFARGLDLSGSAQGAGGVGGLLAVNIATNGVHFAAFDGNGNVSSLISATNGAVSATYEYSPFGETLRANGVVAKANPLRFSTQFADDVTGSCKYPFRDYRPAIGRWPNRDPIDELGGIPLQGFMGNDPAHGVDSLGLKRLTLSYDTAKDVPWWERLNEPLGTKWTSDLAAIKADIENQIGKYSPQGRDGCNCIDKLTFTDHSGVPGIVHVGPGVITAEIVKRIEQRVSVIRKEVAEAQIRKETEFLKSVGAYLCKDGTVDFVQCDAGAGPEGADLKRFLQKLFPPGTQVVLYDGPVGWKWGAPHCAITKKGKQTCPVGCAK